MNQSSLVRKKRSPGIHSGSSRNRRKRRSERRKKGRSLPAKRRPHTSNSLRSTTTSADMNPRQYFHTAQAKIYPCRQRIKCVSSLKLRALINKRAMKSRNYCSNRCQLISMTLGIKGSSLIPKLNTVLFREKVVHAVCLRLFRLSILSIYCT